MSFWFPAAFAFLGFVPLIVVLHMLRKQRQRLVVPSLLLWMASDVRRTTKTGLGKVGNLLALLLSLLILLMLVLALARPDGTWWFRESSTLVIIDARARMQAQTTDGSQAFDRAVQTAEAIAKRASTRHRVGLSVFPDGPVVPFSMYAQPLMNALSSAQPTDASGDLASTVHVARQSQDTETKIIVLTDREEEILPEENVEVVGIGEAADNVAITAFAARPSATFAGMTDVFVRVTNFGNTSQSVNMGLRLDGTLVDVMSAVIAANASFERTVSLVSADIRSSEEGILTVKLDDISDAVTADNSAQILFSTGALPRVLLVSGRDGFLEKAISADSGVQFELLRPESWQAGFVSAFPAIVFDNWVPPEFQTKVPEGNFFFAGKSPWTSEGGELKNPPITGFDAESSLLRGITLEGVRVGVTSILNPPSVAGWRTVLASGDDALLLTFQDPANPERRMVVLGFDPGVSDLPERVAFPLLVSNSINWLIGMERLPTLVAGRGAPVNAGVYEAGAIPGLNSSAAVNPDALAEADIRQASATHDPISGFSQGRLFPLLWQVFLIASLVLLMVEWVAFHRRWFA